MSSPKSNYKADLGLAISEILRRGLPGPVISPIQASVIVAEMLVRAKLSQSKVAFIYPSILDS